MKFKIDKEELSKISFISYEHIDERVVPMLSCFNNDNEWELWLSGPKGLARIQDGETFEAAYFAKSPVSETDGYFGF